MLNDDSAEKDGRRSGGNVRRGFGFFLRRWIGRHRPKRESGEVEKDKGHNLRRFLSTISLESSRGGPTHYLWRSGS